MGILNVTPDSFSDGAQFPSAALAAEAGRRMVDEGAAILDIGGESTRPGAASVPVAEELRRVLPVIDALRPLPVILSVDTRKPAVMRAAIGQGADLVNDVRALRDPGAIEAVAQSQAGVCLMHMQGEPATMQSAPRYDDVVNEVVAFLLRQAQACELAGIARARILLDPGFGFGKTLDHNIALLDGLPKLSETGYPILAGLSRKSMLGTITGRAVSERLSGSIALAVLALERGVRVLRVHDVGATVDAVRVWSALRYAN